MRLKMVVRLNRIAQELSLNGLIVLRHEFLLVVLPDFGIAQQGHRDNARATPTVSLRRMVAMELGTWRSGRSGGASGSVTFGKGRLREETFAPAL